MKQKTLHAKGTTHITYSERQSIERYIKKKKGVNDIARNLSRSNSSISEEIRKGSKNGRYTAVRAQTVADKRRRGSKQKCLKVALNKELKDYVLAQLQDKQSPESISGRIQHIDTHITYASPKAIYNFVYSVHGRHVERFLYTNRIKRKGGRKRGSKSPADHTKTSIENRPKTVETREEFGHFEGDFIVSGRDGVGSILVLVERKTRYPFVVRVEDNTAQGVNALIETTLAHVLVKSVTLDNDILFQKHEALSEALAVTVYFCHPYASWEKGTVENRNKGVREFVKKKSDISQVPDSTLKEAETHLRTRFMKCLGFYSPQEMWEKEVQDLQQAAMESMIEKTSQSTSKLYK
jgi:transposase, IS30 family